MSLGAWAVSGIVARLRRRRHRVARDEHPPGWSCSCGLVFAACSPADNQLLAQAHAEQYGGELIVLDE